MLDLGLHLGLEYLGFAPRSVGYVERDSYAASRLLERMEEQALEPAPVWAGNLEAVRWERWAGVVDCIVAGFPCQPHSMAGSRKGTDDARWIWPAIADCIRVVRPRLVYLENVSGLRSSGGMAPVLADLAALGFSVEWDSVRASDVGASHQRERVFILGYARHHAGNAEQRQQSQGAAGGIVQPSEMGGIAVADEPQHRRGEGWPESGREQGRSDVAERGGAVGDSGLQHCQLQQRKDGPEYQGTGAELANTCRARRQQIAGSLSPNAREQAEPQGRSSGNDQQPTGEGSDMADTSQPRREGREQPGTHVADGRTDGRTDSPYRPASELRDVPLFAPGPNDERWPAIIEQYPYLAPATEPGLCFMADGLAVVVGESRPDQLRAIGNGVVPLQAALSFVVLARRAGIA